MIFLKIEFVARSTTEMLLEFEFCIYIVPVKESDVKLTAEPKALILGNKELAWMGGELLTISTATSTIIVIMM